ncbi:hypothetical protein ABZX75_30655 [Streptomyces sp. NPDC003038]|uniref:hypothetical protein n=1 Tax=unclassified Streptomyces TaxID=2593676 RepID=UPI0033B07CBC
MLLRFFRIYTAVSIAHNTAYATDDLRSREIRQRRHHPDVIVGSDQLHRART